MYPQCITNLATFRVEIFAGLFLKTQEIIKVQTKKVIIVRMFQVFHIQNTHIKWHD